MKTISKILTIGVVLISVSGASENAKDGRKQSPIPEAVNAIEQSLSAIDRRAILARVIGSQDRLRAERISPLEGENERLELIEWIERKWQLSDDSEFRRYFSDRGVKESRDIASLLIAAWVANYENGEIAEEELFRNQLVSHESIRVIARMMARMQARIQVEQEKTMNAQQDGTEKPDTRPQSKLEGSQKPQPEAEGPSR